MKVRNVGAFGWLIIGFIGLFSIFVFSILVSFFISCEYSLVREIRDFELSAGGLGSPSLCKIVLETNETITKTGRYCYSLIYIDI